MKQGETRRRGLFSENSVLSLKAPASANINPHDFTQNKISKRKYH